MSFKLLNMKSLLIYIFILATIVSCTDRNMEEKSTENSSLNPQDTTQNILFFGNSITAGYGLPNPSVQSFPGIIQKKIDSLNLNYKVINAGLSGETTAGGRHSILGHLRSRIDIFVLELGANDGLRGVPVSESIANLQAIVNMVKTEYPAAKLVLLGMKVPSHIGGNYGIQFNLMFEKIAKDNNMIFVPFLLENVAGIPSLNLQDGIHPTVEGQKIVAENVWKVLKPIL